jgi:hypothetical protein
MTNEREDGVERLRHEGRVHRWSRRSPTWAGHTTFVAIKAGEAVLGDRYAGEGVERTYACDLRSLLDGCFHTVIGEQLGARVLEELLVEARRELGEGPATATSGATPSGAASGASAPASASPPAKVVSARSKPGSVTVPSERPSAPSTAAPSTVATTTAAASGRPVPGTPCELTVVACRSVGLPLAVALRGITRTPVHELLGRLRSLPCRIAAGVPFEQAEALAARLTELGAEVRLEPARAS